MQAFLGTLMLNTNPPSDSMLKTQAGDFLEALVPYILQSYLFWILTKSISLDFFLIAMFAANLKPLSNTGFFSFISLAC